jgi:N-methylhydantoinase B
MSAAGKPRTGADRRRCAAGELDPVTQEILAYAFSDVAEEMAVVEYRSSFSPIIREMLDFSCGVFDAAGRMVAHSEQIPAQLGLMQFTLQAALDKHARLGEGDVVLANHPYQGGTHTPDLQVFMPAYVEGELVGYTGSIAHHIDVGGRVPGTESTENTELFQEGLLFPAVKLVERGRRVEPLWELIAANVRDTDATLGDLAAQIAACRRGIERISDLSSHYSTATVSAAMEALLEQTSERARAEFERWPDREVEAEGFLDDDGSGSGDPVRIAASVRVREGDLQIDLSKSAPQVDHGVNVPWASTHAGVYFAVRSFVGSEIRQNDGLTRHICVHAPEGTILRPRFPAAVSARHLTVQRLSAVLSEALGELLPDRAMAPGHVSFPAFTFQATDPRTGRLTILADILGGGGGARPDADGDDAIDTYTSNCALLPTEVAELEYPWRIERTELIEGSGGEGHRRGGAGLRRDYLLLAEESLGPYYIEQARPEFTAPGIRGGRSARPARVRVRRYGDWEEIPGKGLLRLRAGEVVSFESAGGGGFGAAGGDVS